MSRPKPTIILEHTDTETHKSEQILKAQSIYSVFFDGEPINLRVSHIFMDYPGPKYKKVSFSNPGHAFNLAERLNKKFSTDKFSVVRLDQGTEVKESDIIKK